MNYLAIMNLPRMKPLSRTDLTQTVTLILSISLQIREKHLKVQIGRPKCIKMFSSYYHTFCKVDENTLGKNNRKNAVSDLFYLSRLGVCYVSFFSTRPHCFSKGVKSKFIQNVSGKPKTDVH